MAKRGKWNYIYLCCAPQREGPRWEGLIYCGQASPWHSGDRGSRIHGPWGVNLLPPHPQMLAIRPGCAASLRHSEGAEDPEEVWLTGWLEKAAKCNHLHGPSGLNWVPAPLWLTGGILVYASMRGGQGCEGGMSTGHPESDADEAAPQWHRLSGTVLIRLDTDHRSSQLMSGGALLASPTLPVLGRKWSWGPSGTAAAAEQGLGAPGKLCPKAQGDPALWGGSRSRGREAAATCTEWLEGL